MALKDEILTLKNKEGTLTDNKVCNFAYDDTAFEDDTTAGANGVTTYNYNNHNNIPVKDPTVLKINATIIAKGFRSQVSVLPRMLLNHIFGRVSYNLNKTVDTLNSLLSNIYNYIGQPNGLATLDNTGRLPYSQLPLSAVEYKGAWNADTNTPTLASGTGTFGDEYIVSVQGTKNLGEGSITYRVGDRVIYNGSIWQRIPASSVRTVNSKTPDANGNVTVNASDMVTPDVYGYVKSSQLGSFDRVQNGYFKEGCYAKGLWTVGSTTGVWWSEDNGGTWTQCSGSISSVDVKGVYYANGLWLAYTNSNGMWWSGNGKDWTQCTGITSGANMTKPRYANGLWVAGTAYTYTSGTYVEYGLWWSEDGKAWSLTLDSGSRTSTFPCVEYVNGLWVAGCNSPSSLTGESGIWTSDDGKTWSRLNINFYGGVDFIKYANDMWIAGGSPYTSSNPMGLWWSLDGKTWTQGTGNFDSITTFIEYANGIWVTGGKYTVSGGSIRYRLNWSTDGKTWSHGSIPSEQDYEEFVSAYYSKGIWVACTDFYSSSFGGGLFKSEDGKTWTRKGSATGYVHKDSGKWLVFGHSGIYMETGTRTNNVATILDWLLYVVDNILN